MMSSTDIATTQSLWACSNTRAFNRSSDIVERIAVACVLVWKILALKKQSRQATLPRLSAVNDCLGTAHNGSDRVSASSALAGLLTDGGLLFQRCCQSVYSALTTLWLGCRSVPYFSTAGSTSAQVLSTTLDLSAQMTDFGAGRI